jgi:hypothetical protein
VTDAIPEWQVYDPTPAPRVSVFTPSHDPKWLDKCYDSLVAQTYKDWEWTVVPNGDWGDQTFSVSDPRVRVFFSTHPPSDPLGVGKAKESAVSGCRGHILVELDHDDELTPTALADIVRAFGRHPEAALVYSDTIQINEDGTTNYDRWRADHGWDYRPDGSAIGMAPTPHNVSYIWYAPNHVRAFTRTAYDKAGGYDPERDILDDQDLMSRLYQVGEFVHLPDRLYRQRIHPGMTQKDEETNARIQRETVDLYDRYIQPNALAWTQRGALLALDLGGAHNCPPGYLPVDKALGKEVFRELKSLPDSSVGVIRAVDFLEHIDAPIRLMNECYRVLAHGGMMLTLTPSADGRGAYQDPTHVSYWVENSFWYYTDANYAKYIPEIKCRFQVSRLFTNYPSQWHADNHIPYVCANLVAIKDGPRQGGILSI